MLPRLSLFLLLAAASGCGSGPATWPVKGKVVYTDGGPLTVGVVEFAPVDGGPAARSVVGPDGSFQLRTGKRDGAVAGLHRVVVVQLFQTDGAPAHHHTKRIRRVHARYRSFETSGLERTVERKANEFVLEIELARD